MTTQATDERIDADGGEVELLTLAEVARRLSVSVQQARRYVWDGELKLIKLGDAPNSAARVRLSDLRAFIDRRAGVS